jgi:hypothetical protein
MMNGSCKRAMSFLHANCTTIAQLFDPQRLTFQLVIRLIVSACFELFIIYMVVCVSGSRGEGNALAKSACLDCLSPRGCLSHGCTARPRTQQMSSLYARATPQRKTKKPSSRPAAGVLVVYIYYPQKIPPPSALVEIRAKGGISR